MQYGKIAALPDCLLNYRVHNNQITALQANDNDKYILFEEFARERLTQLGICYPSSFDSVFFKYTNGKAREFSLEDLRIFGEGLIRIMDWNQKTAFFDCDALRERMQNACLECGITNRSISNLEAFKWCVNIRKYFSRFMPLKCFLARLR